MVNPDPKMNRRSRDPFEEAHEREWCHPSFATELFRGVFRWELVHPYPRQDDADRAIGDRLIAQVRDVLKEFIDPNEVDRTGILHEEALLALGEAGCFGMRIPAKYGGLGLSHTNYNRVIGFVGSYCASTAAVLSAHQGIGAAQPLLLYGTETQRELFLPRVARGAISGFALTEPGVGSDPTRVATVAEPVDGGAAYRINGEKLYCTNGPVAELLLVMALTGPVAADGGQLPRITAFLVETDTPGFQVQHRCAFMGLRGISNGLLRLRDVIVPAANRVGAPGDGLGIAMTVLNTGRLAMAATAAAAGKVSLYHSQAWCNNRAQGGEPVGRHQAVGAMTAAMAADTFSVQALGDITCAMADEGGHDLRVEAAMSKLFAAEAGWRMADDFLQIRGGRGFETAESLARRGEDPVPAERMLRDARAMRLIGGTSEITRLFIAREAMNDKTGDTSASGSGPLHWLRLWLPAGGPVAPHLNDANQGHLRFVASAARRLARARLRALARHGGTIMREHLVLRALVDAATDLFVMAATLSRAEALLADVPGDPASIQDLADYQCTRMRERVDAAFRSLRTRRLHSLTDRVSAAFLGGRYAWMADDVYTGFPAQFLSRSKTAKAAGIDPDEPDAESQE